jgi:Fe-S cluster biosynthesis and repair protein YggX
MPTLDERIAQFENMTAADPDNDMAHFSLGSAYLHAERHADAAASFERCVGLNPEMSKAYQLAGEALIATGETERAAVLLERGFEIAASKGDVMPLDAMGDLLRTIGREPPLLEGEIKAAAERIAASGSFICKLTGHAGTQLPAPPLRGPLGEWIFENISAETWQTWIAQGTKVINELRLDFSREEDQAVYDEHMAEFLGIPEEVVGGP